METFVTSNFEIVHIPSVTELLAAREKLIGYRTVVVELGEAPTHLPGDHSQRPVCQSAIGSVREATYSGPAFELIFREERDAVLHSPSSPSMDRLLV